MRALTIATILGVAAIASAASAQERPDQKAYFGLYKELVETNTTLSSRQLHAGRSADRRAAEGGGLCRWRHYPFLGA